MSYNFKSIADVEVVAEPTESANVLIEEDGVIKKAPKTAVGGGNTEWDAVIEYYSDDDFYIKWISGDYQTLYNKLMVEHEIPKVKVISTIYYYNLYTTICQAQVMYDANNGNILLCYTNEGYYANQIVIRISDDNSFQG